MMLVELAVRDLGVIEDMSLVLSEGMTALTGETGAGKTLVVGALALLLGGRAEADMVRPGAAEAVIEGRFARADEEVVLKRVIPAKGRSRAYIDGQMATVAALAAAGAELVELHGQHAHQALLTTAAQREALDVFAGIDLGPLRVARDEVRRVVAAIDETGGDVGARAREVDLLRYQLNEIDAAALTDPDEDASLDLEEDRLAGAQSHIEALALAREVLTGEGGAVDAVGLALQQLAARAPFASIEHRLRGVFDEMTDVVADLRAASEDVVDDPERLAAIRVRRQLLLDLRRKYGNASISQPGSQMGEPTLAGVIAYAQEARQRLADLEGFEQRAAVLDAELSAATQEVERLESAVGDARRNAAPRLATAVQAELRNLGMERARIEVSVSQTGFANDVEFRLAANPGSGALALAKVASGGELARAMLALRLVLSTGAPTMVFDEVDAGIGGEAAVAVGRALARLGSRRQVLVVTHLPQVAASADGHVSILKAQTSNHTATSARHLDTEARVIEISRMLSGSPDSDVAHQHARELLASSPNAAGEA